MSLVNFAKTELELLEAKCGDAEALKLQKMITDDILKVVQSFSEAGHSGSSAAYAIDVLTKLLKYRPLTPLTGNDDEWEDVSSYCDGKVLYQNKRFAEVFKDEDGRCYWTSAKYFSEDEGHTWFSSKDSQVNITLPFTVPAAAEFIIIDNKARREAIKNSIYDKIAVYINGHKLTSFKEFDSESLLVDYIQESDLEKLENVLIETFKLNKLFNHLEADTTVWQTISWVMLAEDDMKEE